MYAAVFVSCNCEWVFFALIVPCGVICLVVSRSVVNGITLNNITLIQIVWPLPFHRQHNGIPSQHRMTP